MKKLCILQNGLARGGTDTFVVNLCRGLDKSKFDITVINPSNRDISRVREQEVLDCGVKILHTTPLTSLKNKFKHLLQLYFFLKKNKIDIIQTNIDLFNGPNLFVAYLAGVPVRCCHSHNTRQNRELNNGNSIAVNLYQNLMKYLCRRFSNRKCGCSEDAMNFLYPKVDWRLNKYPSIIHNGIDLTIYNNPVDVSKKKITLELSNKYHILTIGHFINQKNPIFTAKMFVDLCKVRNDVDLVWIGEGKLKQDVMDIFEDAGIMDRVHLLGYRTDINEIMKCCNLFILPSSFEGLGIVVIEAQASNLPCLISDNVPSEANCGGAIHLPIENGSKCWVDNINKVLDGQLELKTDSNKLNMFSIENMCEQMTKVFES